MAKNEYRQTHPLGYKKVQLQKKIDKAKFKQEETISKVRVDSVLNTKEYIKAKVEYYDFLRSVFRKLVGTLFVLHNYEIDGIKYPTVYCVVRNVPDYSLKRIKGYQSTTEIINKEVSGVELDDSHFYELPIACICVSCSDECEIYCQQQNNNSNKKYAGCIECLKDASENDYCVSIHLRTALYPISDYVLHDLDNIVDNFCFENEIIDCYRYDYIVKLYESYERHLFEEKLYKIHMYTDPQSYWLSSYAESFGNVLYSESETDIAYKYLFGERAIRPQTWENEKEFKGVSEIIDSEDDEEFDLYV